MVTQAVEGLMDRTALDFERERLASVSLPAKTVSTTVRTTVIHEEDSDQARAQLRKDVQAGLSSEKKELCSMYFYDDIGSALFTQITQLDEYYLTNCEINVLHNQGSRIVKELTSDATKTGRPINIIELGAGDGTKTCILLQHLCDLGIDFNFFPIDISRKAVEMLSFKVHSRFGDRVRINGIVGDNIQGLEWIRRERPNGRNVALFLGSSIGNFETDQAVGFLSSVKGALNDGDKLLIGFDLLKDPEQMRNAYSDSRGVTAEFNYNLLKRINDELNADFDRNAFFHVANFNVDRQAMESWLVSSREQTVTIPGCGEFKFGHFEGLHTEYSHKYSEKSIAQMAFRSGFEVSSTHLDDNEWFVDCIWTVR